MTINTGRELILSNCNVFVLAFLLWCCTLMNLLFFILIQTTMYLTPGVLLFLLYKYSFPDSTVMNSNLNEEDLIASMQVIHVV